MSLVHPRQSPGAVNVVSLPIHRGLHTHATPSSCQRLTPSSRHSVASTARQKRSFFSVGEILHVVANPASTLRSLTESRQLLEEARREIVEARERAQLRPSHTFSRLPNFFPRPAELQAVGRALEEEPCFTVLFGASSVGKTALLRQLLTSDKYHVLHFDLRIAGFADLDSLYISLSQQAEQYFNLIADMKGYEDFEKEAWSFKHDRLNVERRLSDTNGSGQIRTSDIARLMELFQSSLLKYREFIPQEHPGCTPSPEPRVIPNSIPNQGRTRPSRWWPFRSSSRSRVDLREPSQSEVLRAREKPATKSVKKMPVLFLDEAHKLHVFHSFAWTSLIDTSSPGLIQSVEAMKALLDSMLVLTKQDQLCHVIHATSDPFYQTWLRQLNVMQHCKIITIGDCSKAETRVFFEERVLPRVHERLRSGLEFERLYEAFGGRLVHIQDYVTDYVNSNGRLEIHQSSHFIQAHALLNLHIIHTAQNPQVADQKPRSRRSSATAAMRLSGVNPTSPTRSGGGFPIYPPLTGPTRNQHAPSPISEPGYVSDFTALQLLRVMSRLTQPGVRSLPYFMLCREFGVRAVDGMVRGRILDLRWMDPVTKEGPELLEGAVSQPGLDHQTMPTSRRVSIGIHHIGASSSGTAIVSDSVEMDGMDGEPYTLVEQDLAHAQEDDEIFGPKVLPATPIMRYAMREVVAEYEDTRSVSEYASLSDMEDY
ncbi:hypothetical protein DFH94DRAFT_630595 [Russula ochroleuca]|uniref:AAA+ ATPase domain-containing protein n=1 Tax=Russula ochroleuca TaxID=152965 RepID=A0A9P5T9I7_9AGAM|nr:hypothetical protein DFH94DRAFT_630595 [Russula ochroleuca]